MLRFRPKYLLWTIILFGFEFYIGKYLHDAYIRPFGGDVLVVMLIYCFVRAFFNIRIIPVAMGVLIFSFVIEWTQYLHLIKLLSLQHNLAARLILGTSFAWSDLLAYTIGIAIVLVIEAVCNKKEFAR